MFSPVQELHSPDIFKAEKISPLAKLIKLQEGIGGYNGQYLLSHFLTDGHVDRQHQLRNDADLRIPIQSTCNSACTAI